MYLGKSYNVLYESPTILTATVLNIFNFKVSTCPQRLLTYINEFLGPENVYFDTIIMSIGALEAKL